MIRLVFALIVILALASAILVILSAVSATKTATQIAKGENMPSAFQNIAYVALIILMFGICAGVLGLV